MSKKKKSWFRYHRENKSKLLAICPVNTYRVCSPEEFTGLLPSQSFKKAVSVFAMSSGTSNGDIYLMANVNRIDWNNGQMVIDQEPYGFYIRRNEYFYSPSSGCCVHHGTWDGRTTPVPENILDGRSNILLDVYCPEVSESLAGSIDDLKIESQHKAFQKILSVLAQ